jgi:hypothetical protein
MKLYHGTNAEFQHININESRVGKDFGVGFYLTPDKHVAQRQAERKYEQYGIGKAKVYEYYVNEDTLLTMRVLRVESYTLNGRVSCS